LVKPVWIVLSVVAVCAGVLCFAFFQRRGPVAGTTGLREPALGSTQAVARIAAEKSGARLERPASRTATGGVGRATGAATNAAPARARTPDERDADTMRALLDSGDEKGALKIARRLLDSEDADVRSRVLIVLGWIGLKALPELTQMLADKDDSVASDAFTQWKMAFEEIQEDDAKAELLVAAMGSMRHQEDMESLVMSVDQLKEDLAVAALVGIIQGENKVAGEVAREHYAFVTQSDYTTPEAAAQWIQENVEPEEPEEDDPQAAP
jgi:hypothetical protein